MLNFISLIILIHSSSSMERWDPKGILLKKIVDYRMTISSS